MRVPTVILGLGNVGRRLLELLAQKRELLLARFDLEFVLVAVADSSAGKVSSNGFDLTRLASFKSQQGKLADYRAPQVDALPQNPVEMLEAANAELLVELTPVNLKNGEPGLTHIRTALGRKMSVVTANKGPLVLAFQELARLAHEQEVRLLYSATVTGGLPTLNIGRRDLGPAEITGFEGVVNATTNYILTRMAEGESFDAALEHAQKAGHAEADPSLDVDGWDAANKLVIIANSVLRRPTRLDQVEVVGIRDITAQDLQFAREAGQVIKLVARAEKKGKDFALSVKPTRLPLDHPLARVNGEMMGVVYQTDINGTILATIEERDPYPTAAAVLRDMVNVYT